MDTSKCQVCGGPVDQDVAATLCPLCATPLHPECWEYNGGCTTYACKESPSVKNSHTRQRPEVYIDEPAPNQRVPYQDRRTSSTGQRPLAHYPPPNEPFSVRLFHNIGSVVASAVALFMLAGFVSGFVEGLSGKGSRSSRRSHRSLDRAGHLRAGDPAAHRRELASIATEKRATDEEMRLVNSLLNWNPDSEIRQLAFKAATSVTGHRERVMEIVFTSLRAGDPAIRGLARAHLEKMGPLTHEHLSALLDVAVEQENLAEEIMAFLERAKPDPQLLLNRVEGKRLPSEIRKRLTKLAFDKPPR